MAEVKFVEKTEEEKAREEEEKVEEEKYSLGENFSTISRRIQHFTDCDTSQNQHLLCSASMSFPKVLC